MLKSRKGFAETLGAFWIAPLLPLYLLAVLGRSRGISYDSTDAVSAITNSLVFAGFGRGRFYFDATRPALGCLILAPAAALGFHRGGALGAIEAVHAFMPCVLVALLWAFHRLASRLYSPLSAGTAVLLLSLNPLLLRYAPFALFDIMSALALLVFLRAALRYVEEPGRRTAAWALASYVAAVLTRFQLCVMIAVPIALVLFTGEGRPRDRLRAAARCPLWLGPALAYPALVLFAAFGRAMSTGAPIWEHVAEAQRTIVRASAFANLVDKPAGPWQTYALALARDLGWVGFAAMAAGAAVWLRRGARQGLLLALALGLYVAVMSFAVHTKEDRYIITVLPLVYAAVGQGLEALRSSRLGWKPAHALAAAALIALSPWSRCADAWIFLAREPSYRSRMPRKLGEALKAAAPEPGRARWIGGDLVLHGVFPSPDDGQQVPTVGMAEVALLTDAATFALAPSEPGSVAVEIEAPEGDYTMDRLHGFGSIAEIRELFGARRRWRVFDDDVVLQR